MTAGLLVLRHAPTAWNAEGRIQGRTDIGLSAEGRQLAAGWRLPPEAAQATAYSSPLSRCLETARLLGLEPEVEPGLAELSWGSWEGRLRDEMQAERDRLFAAHSGSGLDFAVPGGECGRDLARRLAPWLARVGRRQGPAVAVSHRGVLTVMLALATGWDMKGKPPAKLADGCCHRFGVSARGELTLEQPDIPL